MNTYDFDKTIFYPDSSVTFIKHCFRKYPWIMLKNFPGVIPQAIAYAVNGGSAAKLKEKLFAFLKDIPDIDSEVERFWAEHRDGIGEWYLRQKKDDDVIISASPEFLLEPVCREFGVNLIGTRMDKHSGKIDGENCHDKEKVRRFYERYPDGHSDEFYSDSMSDLPMAEISDRAFMLKKHVISPWLNK